LIEEILMSEKKLTFGCDPETAERGPGGAIHGGYNMDDPPPREGVEFETMEEMVATRDVLVVGHADNGLASIQAALNAEAAKPKCIVVNPKPSTISPEVAARMMTPYVIEYRPRVNLFQNHMKRWMKGR
jgi:hypothetical protein